MGNKQANDTNISLTNQVKEDWIKIQDQGYCQLWGNKKTNQRFQAYPISDATAKDNVQIEKYTFRKIHNAFLVSAQAVINPNQTFLCSQPATSFVLIENIPNRLRSFPRTFTFQEGLYILSSSATGYNTLCSFFGPLEPNEDLICFNDNGNVKVWLNENLSKNQASFHTNKHIQGENLRNDDYNFAKRRSRECVQKLLQIVDNAVVNGFPRNFYEQTKELSTFFEVSNFVDYYCEQNMIKIPSSINLNRSPPLPATTAPPRQIINYTQVEQPVQILQSSRVNKVYRPNYPNEVFTSLPPIQQNLTSSLQPRYQGPPISIQFNPRLNQIQGNKISYIPPPPVTQTSIIQVRAQQRPQLGSTTNKQVTIATAPQPQNIIYPLVNLSQGSNAVCPQEPAKASIPLVLEIQPNITVLQQSSPSKESRVNYEQPINKLAQLQLNESLQQQKQPLSQPPKQSSKQFIGNSQEQLWQEQQQNYFSTSTPHQNHEQYIQQQHQQFTKPVYQSPNQQNYYHQQYYQEQNQPYEDNHNQNNNYQKKELVTDSAYSHIQPYVPPIVVPQTQPIMQTLEEQISSPKKSYQILQWEQKLNQFTQSKQHPKPYNSLPQQTQPQEKVQVRQPQSFKNLVVSDQRQEYVNELADLQNQDIEKYIRMKYQSYLNEKSGPEPVTQQHVSQHKYNLTSVDQFRYPSEQTQYNSSYNYQYQPNSYESYHEKQNLPTSKYYEYGAVDNRISIEKNVQETPSNSNKYLIKEYQYRYDQPDQINFQDNYQSKRNIQRNKSKRASNIIDQKYSKYVLNSQKQSKKNYNYQNISQEVSLILPTDESNFINRQILENSFKKQTLSRPSQKKGVTYEKLRNLLWEE